MRKKFNFGRLGALALALTLVTTCLMGGTLAKYTSTVEGSGTVKAAGWSFQVNGKTETLTEINLATTRDSYKETTVNQGVIAPGTSGHFDIEIDGTGSEVGIGYKISIKEKSTDSIKIPDNMLFAISENGNPVGPNTKLSDLTGADGFTGTINYSNTENAMKKTVTVYWKWDDATEPLNDNDSAGATWNLDISVTGTQVAPEAETAP